MLTEKVRKTIKRHSLISPKDRIIVGVSGGPDSLCLLYILKELSEELNLMLTVAHLDHMLRKESGEDAKFVATAGKSLNIPVVIKRMDIRRLHKTGSLEENARNTRLAFLIETAKKIKADKIALAHNSDDQAETVLMRIIRGSGLYGLSGILPMKLIHGHKFIRPLIETPRKDIEKYLRIRGLKARLDKTNLGDVYFRNKIRNKLIPMLKKEYNPKISDILNNLAESAGKDYDFLNICARRLIKNNLAAINLIWLRKLHPAMQRIILRSKIAGLQGSTRRISLQHIREIEDLISARPTNSIVDLPMGISVVKKPKTLKFYRR